MTVHATFPTHSAACPPHDPLPFSRRRSWPGPLASGSPAGDAYSRAVLPPLPLADPAGEPALDDSGRRTPGATFAGVPVAAFEAMMERRVRQVRDFGHVPENDLKLRPTVLPSRAERAIVNALEDMHFQKADDWRERAKLHLADAGAFVAAAWDYLDNGGAGR